MCTFFHVFMFLFFSEAKKLEKCFFVSRELILFYTTKNMKTLKNGNSKSWYKTTKTA